MIEGADGSEVRDSGGAEGGSGGRLTDRARKALALARDEARSLDHDYLGTEHILLGLAREGDGVAARVLRELGVALDRARDAVGYIVGRGEGPASGEVSLTPRAGRVLALAREEAAGMSHAWVGTEHLLLGLLGPDGGVGAAALEHLGVPAEEVRARVLRVLEAGMRPGETGGRRSHVVTCRLTDRDVDAIDALVEAGIRSTRSDAASWLIGVGIATQQPLFDRVHAAVSQIRQLRTEARSIAEQVAAEEPAG